jgi:hypothetical protein
MLKLTSVMTYEARLKSNRKSRGGMQTIYKVMRIGKSIATYTWERVRSHEEEFVIDLCGRLVGLGHYYCTGEDFFRSSLILSQQRLCRYNMQCYRYD